MAYVHLPLRCIFTLEQAQSLCSQIYPSVRAAIKTRQQQLFDDRCKSLEQTVNETSTEHQQYTIRSVLLARCYFLVRFNC